MKYAMIKPVFVLNGYVICTFIIKILISCFYLFFLILASIVQLSFIFQPFVYLLNFIFVVQESYKSSLPVFCFLPNVETEKIIFEQKLGDILDDLHNCTMDAKELEDVDKVEYYYTQIVYIIYEWIEFIEHWILKVDVLPVDQNMEQCKVS